MINRILVYSRFIKVEHTLFALPILISGALIANQEWPATPVLVWIVIAAFGARTFAMAVNRILDHDIDAQNPRTADRDLPTGRISLNQAWGVAVSGALIYLGAAAALEPNLLWWAPIPLAIFWAYPQLKRWTKWSHLGVGVSLACAPIGAWMGVIWESPPATQSTFVSVFFLAVFMFFWATGFDVIYSTLDEEFDRAQGVHSLPAYEGREGALFISALFHIAAFVSLGFLYLTQYRTVLSGLCLILIGMLLFLEQRKADDVPLAFFKINAVIGFLVLAFIGCGVYGI